MTQDTAQQFSLLKELKLFSGLDDEQLTHLAREARPINLEEGEVLPLPGDRDYPFFVVASGKLRQMLPGKGKVLEKVVKRGDFFGAEILLLGHRRVYLVKAAAATQLLAFEADKFAPYVRGIPNLRTNIQEQLSINRLTSRGFFNWLGEDETVYLIRRQHLAYLVVFMLKPLLVAWLALMALWLASYIGAPSFRLVVEWIGFGLGGVALLWAAYTILDWENDFYIVTDQRVVWLERMYGLYDSRQEAPLNAVKSEEVKTTLWGRMLGYGDVITYAFLGQITFRGLAQPRMVQETIDALRERASIIQLEADQRTMEAIIRQKIEPPAPEAQSPEQPADESQAAPSADHSRRALPIRDRLRLFFRTHIEEGDVITYRKHAFILLKKTFIPGLILVLLLAAIVYLYILQARGVIQFPAISIIMLGLVLMIPPALWWLYQYVDWGNDIFQITSDRIIDSERKPLGTETVKSAPLDNIISLDYTRIGLLGILLNMGNVVISTGTDQFCFRTIYDPARAQREIFERMYANRRKKQIADATKEWDQVSDWLAAYHRQSEDLRRSKKTP